MAKKIARQTKRKVPLDRFYYNEAGDPSFVNRYIYEKIYAPLEFDQEQSTDKQHIIDVFSETWESTAIFVWHVCQTDDREEPVGWTC